MAPTLLQPNLDLRAINITAQTTTNLNRLTPTPTETTTSYSTKVPKVHAYHQPAEKVLIIVIGATCGVTVVVFLMLMIEKYIYKRGKVCHSWDRTPAMPILAVTASFGFQTSYIESLQYNERSVTLNILPRFCS
ncbi:hypothetical protein L211DRAFT_847459 [Terfezia boudieri ATCC MYA-4762]|uniref:Uncharacterized protein n=1 Tax=Terfezia boudieri ATCC MYA-4762 TaxID=1051890 RepID=A0A3N4M8Y2_9PEZI|nr:hypothetical protein L211DRAFT_847459 [Terfezia boudieri ATCC MYA-4762]